MAKKLITEEDAAAALAKGREAGLNFFFELYYTPLTWYAYRLTEDKPAAEDIVAETFVKLWKGRAEATSHRYVKHFLYRVVRHGAIDFVRRERAKTSREKEVQYLNPVSEDVIIARLIETELHHQVFLSLESLPARMGVVFRMFYLQGKSYGEIARELKISIHTVRNQRNRALELLRQQMLLVAITLLFT